MPKIRLHLFDISPPCQAVIMTAKILSLELEFTHINPYEGHSPELFQLNPQHTVPVIVDEDGTTLWDSHSIIIYLATKYGKSTSLYPEDPVTRAHIHQFLHFNSGILFARTRFAVDMIFHLGAKQIPHDRVQNVYKAYETFEATLSHFGSQHLVGDSLTLADLSCFSTIITANRLLPVVEEKSPKTVEWIERMKKEPFYSEVTEEGADDASKVFLETIRKFRKGNYQ